MRKIIVNGRKMSVAFVFASGMAAGIFLMNIAKGVLLEDTGILDEYTLYNMKNMTVDSEALFYFVLGKRLGSALLLILFSTTYLGYLCCIGFTLWYGTSAGAYLAALAIRYGFKGILLAAAGMFPQYFIFFPVYYVLIHQCEDVYRGIYVQKCGLHFLWGRAGILFLLLMAVVFGCIVESYVNPGIVISFLNIF